MPTILDLNAFIDVLTYITQCMDALDQAVQQRSICTLFGPSGSGKSTLLDQWVRTRMLRPRPRTDAVLIRLRPAGGISMRCILYSRLWHELLKCNRPVHMPPNVTVDKDIKIYNERQLQSLHLNVIEELERLHVRAIVIDNAHLLDAEALEWSLDLRTYYDERHGFLPRRALIFAGQAKATELRSNRLFRLLAENDEASAAWTERIELSALSLHDFVHILSYLIGRNLNATFSEGMDLNREAKMLWDITQGNWYHAMRLVRLLDAALGTRKTGKSGPLHRRC